LAANCLAASAASRAFAAFSACCVANLYSSDLSAANRSMAASLANSSSNA